ncbi:MAG: sigma-70 family RNA polymerase sigma factor [Deltaproteobacteria bacterium]|nr:sigma-70 family RNA polymerase sigma factor [Deltaproteobacteria bacterium]
MSTSLAIALPAAVAPSRSADAEARRAQAARLYRDYGPLVYRRCLRLLRNPTAAGDATQEVFVRLVERLPALAERDSLAPWLLRTARNHCLNQLRGARRHPEADIASADEPAAPETGGSLEGALARSVLSRFDATTQAIALGILVDGMRQEELSAELGLSRRTVARKLDRFLLRARRYLTLAAGSLRP